ncbi:MAG: DMT family transporter [Hyphomonadaceae bacterium]|nr:DMT family transporter [Hyphomonadaceae bacterium]
MTSPAETIAPARPWLGPLLVLLGAVAIGFAPIGLRLSEFEPQATAFWRFAFALPIMVVVVYAQGGKLGRPSLLSIIAGTFFGLDITFWHASLVLTSVANATFIVNLGNAAVGVVAWIALKERPAKIWPYALGIALLGALLLSRGAAAQDGGALAGDLLALAAAVMVGLYLFFAKLARRTESAMQVLFWSTATTLVVSAIAAGFQHETLIPPEPSWFIWPAFLALVAHVIGQGLIVAGVGRTPASVAGILLLIQPVAAALIAWPLFKETLTVVQLAGSALVLAGVWLAGRR